MFRNLNVSKRIYSLIILMLVSVILIVAAFRIGISRITEISINEAQNIVYEDQKEKLLIAVHSIAEALGRTILNEPSVDKQKDIIRNSIKTIRFEEDKSGYFFVYDFWGVNVAHPIKPEFQGTNRLDVRDPEGTPYIRELMEKAKAGGYVEYIFQKPGGGNAKKLAYAEIIPGTDYWIATGFYIDNFETRKATLTDKIEAVSNSLSLVIIAGLVVFILILVLPASQAIVRSIVKPLNNLMQAVKTISQGNLEVKVAVSGNDELSKMGSSFNDMSAKLLEARESLKNHQEHLEELIEQRTEQLSESLIKLEDANHQVLESIQYARTIQQAILPPASVISEHLKDYFVIWDPKDIIGGDLYWFKGADDCFLAGVIDCTGHGVPGAIMTMIAGTTLGRVVNEVGTSDPAKILKEMNRIIQQTLSQNMENAESDDGLDIGLCLVRNDGVLVFAGAKISLYAIKGNKTWEIKGDRYSIGYKSSKPDASFKNNEISIEPGTNFYMTTDGLKDQVGGDKRLPFGKTRLLNLLQSVQGMPLAEQKAAILQAFESYSQGEIRRDDITLFGFRI